MLKRGGTQAIIKFEEDTFHVQNQGLGNLGSKFSLESVEQPIRDITEENATLGYEDTYQVMYQTHGLEINIL